MFVDDDSNIEDDFQIVLNDSIKVNYGDVFQLGNHRLMCGDSTIKSDVDILMDGNIADMLFTDPPYNMGFNGRSGNFDVIENDNLSEEDFIDFINKFLYIVDYINIKSYYICCN